MSSDESKIAVVGGGVAGLTAALELSREHRVTLFEAAPQLGGHANTVSVADPRGELRIDTGFIVMNDRNYPTFTGLLEELGVAIGPSRMGMSMSTEDGSFEFAYTPRGLFAQRSNLVNPRFWRLIADFLRFSRDVRPLAGRADAPTIAEFMRDRGYSEWFVERVMLPQVSGVWSMGAEDSGSFPVGFLGEFLDNHGQLDLLRRPRWQTVAGGSRTYVEAIARRLDDVRVAAPVRSVARTPAGVAIEADGCETELFDEVVLACHSDQALAMLDSPTTAERSVLSAIAYQRNETVLHMDTSVMPRRRRAWASWNFHLGPERAGGPRITYWMNNLQELDTERDYLVSLNSSDAVDPEKIIDTFEYAHPVMTHATAAAQKRWGEISGADRVHYAGAYWRWGFHEDGCWSGLRAASRVGAELPAAVEELAA